LIRDHRGAVEYDFRQRFGLGLRDIGTRLTLAEAGRLADRLSRDPSSEICAAINDWRWPVSREALALMDLFDLEHTKAAGGKKVPPYYLRPVEHDGRERQRIGNAGGRSREKVLSILRTLGHAV
jgi:hypothetical protein